MEQDEFANVDQLRQYLEAIKRRFGVHAEGLGQYGVRAVSHLAQADPDILMQRVGLTLYEAHTMGAAANGYWCAGHYSKSPRRWRQGSSGQLIAMIRALACRASGVHGAGA